MLEAVGWANGVLSDLRLDGAVAIVITRSWSTRELGDGYVALLYGGSPNRELARAVASTPERAARKLTTDLVVKLRALYEG